MSNRMILSVAACASFLLAAAALPATAKAQDGSIFIAAHASTLGAGLALGYDISPSFSARAATNYFAFDIDQSSAGNEYSVDLQFLSLGLMGDWHPFQNGFRVTAGGLFNGNKATLASRARDLDLGSGSYQGNMEAELDFNAVAPYLGIGRTSGRGKGRGFSFFADAGVVFQGSPKLSASGQVKGEGSSCNFSLSDSGRATVQPGCSGLEGLRADLEAEHADLEDQLSAFKLYPVLMLGVTYRF